MPGGEGPPARLTAEELAAALGADGDRVSAMVHAGVLRPAEDGTFEPDDVVRALVADSLGLGLTLDLLRRGIEAGFVTEQTQPPGYSRD